MPDSTPDPFRVRTHAMAHGGEAVGRSEDEGPVWFVEGAAPGEEVEVELTRESRRWRRGHVLRVLSAGPDRVEPPCPLASRCGGCEWQHLAPASQLRLKRDLVSDQLRRVLGDVVVSTPRDTGPSLGYRRRAKMHYVRRDDGLELGFRQARAHALVDVDACIVLEPALDAAMQRVRDLTEHLPAQGNVLGLSWDGQVVLGLPGVPPEPAVLEAAEKLLDGTLVGIVFRGGRQRGHVGRARLEIDGGDGRLPVVAGPFSFAQAQTRGNAALVDHVLAQARPAGRRVLELFAGAGNFTRVLAREAQRVWTVDDDRESVKLLRELAEQWKLSVNAKHGSAQRVLERMARSGSRYDVVVLDPPRKGLGEAASRHLCAVAAGRVVYVSCDPSTLARDLRVLVDGGLRLTDVRVFDLMPMTSQVEVVATLIGGGD